ncbi:MAG: Zn-dependent hydrolase of the beta-lactamase fold-like protein [Deltaproteobacteria bacterium]|nr:Zn-dependent hydrolase of the beta-lactamase fold-like protein [Deltaproteobacteria bacterium]
MKIKWYGHSAFLITTQNGTRIILDPYQSGAFGGALAYGRIMEAADIVLSSHDHDDHNYVADIKGRFKLINKPGDYKESDVHIEGIPSFHDQSGGAERGQNIIYIIEADDMRVAHLGDLGHILDTGTVKKMGRVDILLIPVGGFYTINPEEAWRIVQDVRPVVTIPMHFKTEKCDFPIAAVEEFIKDKSGVNDTGKTEIDLTRSTLSSIGDVVVLRHAL